MQAAHGALRRLAEQSAWAYLAFVMVLGGVAFFLDPSRLAPTTIYDNLPVWLVYAWTASIPLGGAAILGGLISGKQQIERLGYLYLSIAVFVFASCLAFAGWVPSRTFSLINYAAAFVALVARYRHLGRTKIVIEIPRRLADDDTP